MGLIHSHAGAGCALACSPTAQRRQRAGAVAGPAAAAAAALEPRRRGPRSPAGSLVTPPLPCSTLHPRAAAALQYGIERDFTNRTETAVLYDLGAASLQAALVTYSAYTNAKVGWGAVWWLSGGWWVAGSRLQGP